MRPDRDDTAYLWDMLEAAKTVQGFVEGKSYIHFLQDKMLKSAVERQIEIIGEAARKVSVEFRENHPDIPWQGIISQRHVLAHEYGEIKYDRLWHVSTIRINELIDLLTPLIPPIPPEVDL